MFSSSFFLFMGLYETPFLSFLARGLPTRACLLMACELWAVFMFINGCFYNVTIEPTYHPGFCPQSLKHFPFGPGRKHVLTPDLGQSLTPTYPEEQENSDSPGPLSGFQLE